jgi:hypothetical protein
MDTLCSGVKQLLLKIFTLELDNSNWELEISLWKAFALELDNS